MNLEPLPSDVIDLLGRLGASPRLIAHLTLVHDVACKLTARLDAVWPKLPYDRVAVRLGAALHDIGKTVHPDELVLPGHLHELAGEELLRQQSFASAYARFGRTHDQWADEPAAQAEDLLVALADSWWRGKRNERLEDATCHWIADTTQIPHWQVFAALDDIAVAITSEADSRLEWQNQFAA
ncbi:MAG TPA: HD domain-containing protein [Ktedonobacterales bacterium]|nr:HD domain-containing protein [Ktedonobacterales bacterium]